MRHKIRSLKTFQFTPLPSPTTYDIYTTYTTYAHVSLYIMSMAHHIRSLWRSWQRTLLVLSFSPSGSLPIPSSLKRIICMNRNQPSFHFIFYSKPWRNHRNFAAAGALLFSVNAGERERERERHITSVHECEGIGGRSTPLALFSWQQAQS